MTWYLSIGTHFEMLTLIPTSELKPDDQDLNLLASSNLMPRDQTEAICKGLNYVSLTLFGSCHKDVLHLPLFSM